MSDKKDSPELPGSEPEDTQREPSASGSPYTTGADSPDQSTDISPQPETSEDTAIDTDEDTVLLTIDDVVNAGGYGRFQSLVTFLAGLGWLADAFEVIILSVIGDFLACEWEYTRWQNALLTSIVFIGMTVGAPVFGNIADKFGRRISLGISMLFLFIFGAASAASPNYTWMLVLRALMGIALGGIAQGVTLCCEYYPASSRGSAGFYLSYWWAIGATGVVASAWIIMRYVESWRLFVFIASVPALIVVLSMKWYPESARYYLVSNQPDKAMKTLQRLMKMNKKEMPRGTLTQTNAKDERGKIGDLLKPGMRKMTLIFWYLWLSLAMGYYGVALITPIIVTNKSLLAAAKEHANFTTMEDFLRPMPCKRFTDWEFLDLLWTTAAEIPGLMVFSFTIECCPRRIYLGASCFFSAFLILLLMLETKPQVALYVILFVCRGLVVSVFQLIFIMTTESFPTTLRASAMGTGSAFARFGGAIIPLLAQVTVITRPIESMVILAIIIALGGVMAFFLPIETRGKEMKEVVAAVSTISVET